MNKAKLAESLERGEIPGSACGLVTPEQRLKLLTALYESGSLAEVVIFAGDSDPEGNIPIEIKVGRGVDPPAEILDDLLEGADGLKKVIEPDYSRLAALY